ncbi:21006_t:CDS:2, partial [Cetraspora pellucida]
EEEFKGPLKLNEKYSKSVAKKAKQELRKLMNSQDNLGNELEDLIDKDKKKVVRRPSEITKGEFKLMMILTTMTIER